MKGLAIFVSGLLTGAALTALYTPEKGEDLRARIRSLLVKRGIIASDEVDEFISIIAQQIEE